MTKKSTPKFLISVDDQGAVEVRDGTGGEIAPPNWGNWASTHIDLASGSKLMLFDSLAIMGFGDGRILRRICIKRANCEWFCFDV